MKVFKIEGFGDYAGGVVLIVAESAEQAARLGNQESNTTWNVEYDPKDAVEVQGIKHDAKEPTIILHYETGE